MTKSELFSKEIGQNLCLDIKADLDIPQKTCRYNIVLPCSNSGCCKQMHAPVFRF